MKILVVVASKHGSTQGIAEAIAQWLRNAGHTTDVHNAAEMRGLDGYDAVIVGSAIYMGKWMREARTFVDLYQNTLSKVPVWLFSSGPLGPESAEPSGDPAHLDELMRVTRARGHRLFSGDLDKSALWLGERLVVKMVKAPHGDFRDWELIRDWTQEIAAALPVTADAVR